MNVPIFILDKNNFIYTHIYYFIMWNEETKIEKRLQNNLNNHDYKNIINY